MDPLFLHLSEVIEIQQDQVARYGGERGIRDQGLLESALAQPKAQFGGAYLHEDIPGMAGAYLFHRAKNHAFVDGNKRVAAVSARVFLLMNGWRFEPDEKLFENLTLRVAAGEASKDEAIAFFREQARPAGPAEAK